jgi:hypothetical protein
MHVGGGKSNMPFLDSEFAIMKVTGISQAPLDLHGRYKFIDYMADIHAKTRSAKGKYLIGDCNLTYLIPHLTVSQLWSVAQCHNVFVGPLGRQEMHFSTMNVNIVQNTCHYLMMLNPVIKKETIKPYQEDIRKSRMTLLVS